MKHLVVRASLALFFVLGMTSLAFADTASAGPVSDVLVDFIKLAAVALGTAISGLVALGLHYLQRKYKITVDDARVTSLDAWIAKGVAYADEWASNKVKANETINGNDKLNTALRFVLTMVDDKKLVAMGEDKIKLLIEARLNQLR